MDRTLALAPVAIEVEVKGERRVVRRRERAACEREFIVDYSALVASLLSLLLLSLSLSS